MLTLTLVMRLVHVLLGVFWAGTMIFNAVFLGPAMREAGPEGLKVGAGLMRRRFMDVMPVVALLTILSGFWLYWRSSSGFEPAYMGSPTGITFGLGGVLALLAFGLGVGIMRPAMLRAMALTRAAQDGSPDREAQLATAQALRARAGRVGQAVAWLLALAVATMAVARYL